MADIDGLGGNIPFTSSAVDSEELNVVAGEYGEVAAYIPPPPLTQKDIISENTATQKRLLSDAAISAFPIQSTLIYGGVTEADTHAGGHSDVFSRPDCC